MPSKPIAHVDVDRARALGFGIDETYRGFVSDWHSHRRHQLLHAVEGNLELEDSHGRWLLPEAQAAWIPAGQQHRVSSAGARLQTLYLAPSLVAQPPAETAVFQLPALGHALLARALDWPHHRRLDRRARALFVCVAEEFAAWSLEPGPWRLPQPRSEALAAAMRHVVDHLEDGPTLAEAARQAGVSTRSLERRFRAETGSSFREFLLTARMIEAQRLLREPGARVSSVAYRLGYSNPSAFSTAFLARVGQRPKALLRPPSRR